MHILVLCHHFQSLHKHSRKHGVTIGREGFGLSWSGSAIRWSSIWDPAVLFARTTSSKPQLPCLYYVSQKASRYSAGTRVKRGLKYLSPVAGRWVAHRESGHHQHLVLSWSFLDIPHSHPFSTREALTFVY